MGSYKYHQEKKKKKKDKTDWNWINIINIYIYIYKHTQHVWYLVDWEKEGNEVNEEYLLFDHSTYQNNVHPN